MHRSRKTVCEFPLKDTSECSATLDGFTAEFQCIRIFAYECVFNADNCGQGLDETNFSQYCAKMNGTTVSGATSRPGGMCIL